MTRSSIKEYVEAIRGRYLRAGRKEKRQILDEFTKTTGYHLSASQAGRKSRYIGMNGDGRRRSGIRRGRRRVYGPQVVEVLNMAWEATDRLCSPDRSGKPFLGELVRVLKAQGDLSAQAGMKVAPEVIPTYRDTA
jgi:hypothetical protein